MSSLAELRAIEEQRIAMDSVAVHDAEQARVREREQAVRRVRDDEAARIAAEHEATLQVLHEREHAERSARIQVETAEACERARYRAELDERRLTQEVELRRAEVAKKRPTWMVALTLVALVAAGALTWFAIDSLDQSKRAAEGQRVAELDKRKAIEGAHESARKLATFAQDLDVLDKRVTKAIDDVGRAEGAAARATAKIELARLQIAQAALRRKEADAQADHDHRIRVQKIEFTEECKRNPLAKKCVM